MQLTVHKQTHKNRIEDEREMKNTYTACTTKQIRTYVGYGWVWVGRMLGVSENTDSMPS